jgi:hypothetical protein
MDFRNEYRTRDSGFSSLPVRLEFRPWQPVLTWYGALKGVEPGEWQDLSIYSNDEQALEAANQHACRNTPVNVKSLGRLP